MPINIAIIDNHQFLVDSFASMIGTYKDCSVTLKALGGKELQTKLSNNNVQVDIFLVDVIMPGMDGVEVAVWLKENYPAAKIVALSLDDKPKTIIKMTKAGCCCYLLKDISAEEMENALTSVYTHGHYYGGANYTATGETLSEKAERESIKITGRELAFLKLAATEMTYKQMAAAMKVKTRQIDKIREHLFVKLNVNSRTSLCMEALRQGLIEL